MCGIGGVWCFGSELDEKDAEKLKKLAVSLESRGNEAYGFYNGEKVIKFPSRASQVIEMIERLVPWDTLVVRKKMFLMHTRLATTGSPLDNVNNHPFETKHFVMAHNGQLWDYEYYYVVKNGIWLKEFDEPETDSYRIISKTEEEFEKCKDAIEAFKKAMEELYYQGSYAIWIYSKVDDLLMLYRDSNPLSVAVDSGKLWFASEDTMLKKIGFKDVSEIKAGEIFVYDRRGLVKSVKVAEVRQATKFKRGGYWGYNYNYNSYSKKNQSDKENFDDVCLKYCDELEDCMEHFGKYGIKLCDKFFYGY